MRTAGKFENVNSHTSTNVLLFQIKYLDLDFLSFKCL